MKMKHYTDHDHRRTFKQRIIDRLTCNFPLSFCNRIRYPYFCIIILNDKTISYNAKLEFIEKFVKPYMKDSEFVDNLTSLCFYGDNYVGCLDDDERNQFIKNNNLSQDVNSDIIKTFFENYNPLTIGCAFEC